MTRVAQEAIGDIVCVLETLEDIGGDWELRAFSELSSNVLALAVDVLHPAVVVRSRFLRDVLLEDDNVGIGDGLCVGGGEDGSCSLVDGLGAEGWCR